MECRRVKYCPKCDSAVDFTVRFCPHCAFPLGQTAGLVFKVKGVPFHMILVAGTEKIAPFYIAEYLVTQRLWEVLMSGNPSFFALSPQHPVELVSWVDCQEFLRKLSSSVGFVFSLPTRQQWEFAAKGGLYSRNFLYSGSDSLRETGWFMGNSKGRTHPVGELKPNELGIYDMSGNVAEWCADMARKPRSSWNIPRFVSGGAWYDKEADCRIAVPRAVRQDTASSALGFRMVLNRIEDL